MCSQDSLGPLTTAPQHTCDPAATGPAPVAPSPPCWLQTGPTGSAGAQTAASAGKTRRGRGVGTTRWGVGRAYSRPPAWGCSEGWLQSSTEILETDYHVHQDQVNGSAGRWAPSRLFHVQAKSSSQPSQVFLCSFPSLFWSEYGHPKLGLSLEKTLMLEKVEGKK